MGELHKKRIKERELFELKTNNGREREMRKRYKRRRKKERERES